MSYVIVRELLGPHEQAYIARDRSDINLGQGQGSCRIRDFPRNP